MDRIKHAWNAFAFQEQNPQTITSAMNLGPSSSYRPQKTRLRFTNERTIVTAIYNRMAIDAAAVPIKHVRLDNNRQYQQDMSSGLNDCPVSYTHLRAHE